MRIEDLKVMLRPRGGFQAADLGMGLVRDNARVIWLGKRCSPCRRHPTCGGAFHCLRDITPEHVLDVARPLLPSDA